MPRRQTSFDLSPDAGRSLPRIAPGNPAIGAQLLADMLPTVIGKAESLGLQIVAEHLAMALKLAEHRAAEEGER